jgi:hypothetical protein
VGYAEEQLGRFLTADAGGARDARSRCSAARYAVAIEFGER